MLKYDIVLVDNNSNLHHVLYHVSTTINQCVGFGIYGVIGYNVLTMFGTW